MNNIVACIKESIQIIDVINSYTSLKKSGNQYIGKCPFHDDNKPSFSVNNDKGLYHCFACGESGDLIKFLMQKERFSFKETIHYLADKANISIDNEEKENNKNNKIYDLLEYVADYYHFNISESSIDYLINNRGISNKAIKHFRLGYADSEYTSLIKFLKESGYSLNSMRDAGLVVKTRNNNYIDRFINRIIFPIKDAYGRVVGFSGRAMGQEMPKYLNSPETEVFKKGQLLYGLDKDLCRKTGQITLTEGYFDVIRLWENNINSAATMGLNFNLIKLPSTIKKINLAFDADDAGIKLTHKAIDELLESSSGININVVKLKFKDIDEHLKMNGDLELCPAIEWKIKSISGSLQEKADQMINLLKKVEGIEKILYATKCAEILSSSNTLLIQPYTDYLIENSKIKLENSIAETVKIKSGLEKAEEFVLRVYTQYPELQSKIEEELDRRNLSFTSSIHIKIWNGEEVYYPELYDPCEPRELDFALMKMQKEAAIKRRELILKLIKDDPDNKVYHKLFQEECQLINKSR